MWRHDLRDLFHFFYTNDTIKHDLGVDFIIFESYENTKIRKLSTDLTHGIKSDWRHDFRDLVKQVTECVTSVTC